MSGAREYLKRLYCSTSIWMLGLLGVSEIVFDSNRLYQLRASCLSPIAAALVSLFLSKNIQIKPVKTAYRVEAFLIFMVGVLLTFQWFKAF